MPETERDPGQGPPKKLEGRTLEIFEEGYARYERALKKLAEL